MSCFENKVVFITGASSGIGAALSREFAKQGADLALVARRADRLNILKRELADLGRKVVVVQADVTKEGDLKQAATTTRGEMGRIDIVVANAGFGVEGDVASLTLEDFRRQFETNVFGVLNTIFQTLDDLKRSRGILVLMGSVSSYISLPKCSAYSMSKFSVRALAEALSAELKPHGVSVVLINPGFVDSEIRRTDDQGNFDPQAVEPIPAWLRMSAEKASWQIVRAVAGRRREQNITLHGKIAIFLQRHSPWLISLLMSLGNKEKHG